MDPNLVRAPNLMRSKERQSSEPLHMQRLSLSYFLEFGAALKPLKTIQAATPYSTVWLDLYTAETTLNSFLESQVFWDATKSSWALGQALAKVLTDMRTNEDATRQIEVMEAYRLSSALTAYEPVLRAELAVADTYFVTPKGGYNSLVLIQQAENLFSETLVAKVPLAIPEVREAGKCLAFELCTAAGIHMLRALELVLKAYFKVVTQNKPLPTNRNLGAYLKRLGELKAGDIKVVGVLTQIKDLHRNSLMHPEDTLDKEAAISLFGIIISAVNAMLKDIPMPPTQTSLGLPGPT